MIKLYSVDQKVYHPDKFNFWVFAENFIDSEVIKQTNAHVFYPIHCGQTHIKNEIKSIHKGIIIWEIHD